MSEYRIVFYTNSQTRRVPVKEYLDSLDIKTRTKVLKYIEYLRQQDGYLDEPYSKHIQGSIRELRVDFAGGRHRIFYFAFVGKKIMLLHAFAKKTPKTPSREIQKALEHYYDLLTNFKLYE